MTHNTRELEEIERVFLKGKHEGLSWEDAKPIVHHQLQKARTDWLREEIVRLEGMHIKYLPSTLKDPVGFCEGIGRNKTIQTIIDRYLAELDQDKQ